MELNTTNDVLAELDRRNGHLTHDKLNNTVNFYGDISGLAQPVQMSVFKELCTGHLVERTEPPSQTRVSDPTQYKISELGRTALSHT